MARSFGALLAAVALVAAPAVVQAQQARALADGRDWTRSSTEQRRAYLIGVSNVISVGARYDAKHAPGDANTFMAKAQKGLEGTTIDQAIQTVDAWYKAHPDQLDKPVLSVIWREIGKPKLGEAR